MIDTLVDRASRAGRASRATRAARQADELTCHLSGHAAEFIRLTMAETGCSRSLARQAVRLIIARHRPQPPRLRAYLARFTAAHRGYWVGQALAAERAAMAGILIGELAERFSVGAAAPSERARRAEADRLRVAFAQVRPDIEPARPRGLALLDAALRELSAEAA